MPRKRRPTEEIIDLTMDDDDLEEDLEQRAPPPAKANGKKKAKQGGPPAEKRVDEFGHTVRYSSKPNQQTRERIYRALPGSGHRLFLIDRKQLRPVGAQPDGAAETFNVLGATGNVYTVTISRHPHCSCPDHAKGNVCKHILFVMLRVLKLDKKDPRVWQKALLPSEVNDVLNTSSGGNRKRLSGDVMASKKVIDAYKGITGGKEGEQEEEERSSGQRPIEDDDECPICTENLKADPTEKVTFCFSCKNNVHVSCMQKWIDSRKASGVEVTCPFCRAAWVDGLHPHKAAAADGAGGSKYVNLKSMSEAHRNADTSLTALYGDRAVWIEANQGLIGRGAAAEMWNSMQYR